MKEILVYRYEDVIEAPIEVVFDYVDDDDKIRLWNTMFIENIYKDNQKSNVPGTSFKTVQKLDKKTITVESTLIEYEAPYKVIMHSTTKEGVSISKYFLSREYRNTRLIVEASIIPSNIFYKIVTKLLGWTSKFVYDEQYEKLKYYVEEKVSDY